MSVNRNVFLNTAKECVVCGKGKIAKSYGDVCSVRCLHLKIEYNNIVINDKFLTRMMQKNPCFVSRTEQLIEYSKRHGYTYEMVRKKVLMQYPDFFGEEQSA